ncbi:histone-lysine N-methyltransferase SETMAR-like [Oratosquilla oratoria]|uniref:histone-lysine N-methyltransferase SETMAR-like n=1 Tax=Oratosquilla oratoria TaxID=337810 RepID=UPI003F7685A3
MVGNLRGNAPLNSIIKTWAADFIHGRDSLEDDPRPGRPATVTTQEIIDKIHDMLLTDQCLTEHFIATELGISQERVHAFINNHLVMMKVSDRWVPKLLGPDQKRLRCNMSMNNLAIFYGNPQIFIQRFVTIDEAWDHHFQPESKEQSKQWKHHGPPAPKKAKSVISAGKVMASILGDSEGMLVVDYLTKGQSITGPYYASLIKQLREKIKKKMLG